MNYLTLKIPILPIFISLIILGLSAAGVWGYQLFQKLSVFEPNKILGVKIDVPEPTIIIPTITPTAAINADDVAVKINEIRSQNNVKTLIRNNQLDEAAQDQAQDMIDNNYWNTTSPSGLSLNYFIDKAGYQISNSSELLGIDFSSTTDLINSWMNSENKSILLSKNRLHMGVAAKAGYMNGLKSTIIVVILAKPYQITFPKPQATNSANITCTGPDGKRFQTTQAECDKFNIAWGNTKKPTNPPPPPPQKPDNSSRPIVSVSCSTVLGIYSAYGYTMDDANNECKRIQVLYQSWNADNQEILDDYQTKVNNLFIEPTTVIPTTDPAAYNNCRSNAQTTYQAAQQQANGYSASTREAMLVIASQNYQSAMQTCDGYPH